VSIEAMLSLLAFFCILGLFLETANTQLQETEKAIDGFRALAEAKKCALIIDSVFSNSGGMPGAKGINCFQAEKGIVNAKINGSEAGARILAEAVFLNRENAETILEVKSNAHYK